jgi:dynactin complex subunit
MDELGLTVEGIINKTQKLVLRNQQLKEQITNLETDQERLKEQLSEQATRIKQMEEKMANHRLSSALEKNDSLQARQKVNELLREIEKCYALLNR